MSTVYCIRNKEYVQKILSENRVSSDMVDHTSRQTFEQFKSFQKPTIYYDVNDFLICISKDAEKDFEKNKFFDLYRADAFGWYYDKAHKSEIQIFQATSPQKLII